MHRSIPLFALAALALSGCPHLGTNVSGQFSCRAPKAGCQPLSEVDAAAMLEWMFGALGALTPLRLTGLWRASFHRRR